MSEFSVKAPDYSTRAGAERIASHIRRYWARRGYHVTTQVVKSDETDEVLKPFFIVKSDMVRGLPIKKMGE